MKKRLAVILSAILALTMFGGQFAFAASASQFTDLEADGWYLPDVEYVAENGYMVGTSDTTFEPQSNLTRAMFATILARYDGAEVDDSVPTIFTDVEINQWFTGSIGWANEKKIVEGRGDNIFDPTSFITRQELAVMVERYITYVESTTDKVHVTPGVAIPFTDADQISDWAQEAMDKAVIHGLIIGYPDKSVKPLQNITRAETAAVIHRIKWKTRDGRETFTITVLDKDGNEIGKFDKPVGQLIDPFDLTDIEAPYGLRITLPDGTTTTVQKGDKIMLDGDITVEPIVDFEVTRIDSVDDKELGKDLVKPEESYTVPEGPAKSGHTFKEWNTEKDGTGTAYQPDATIDLTGDLTLYAIYTKNSSGGSGPSVTSEKYTVKASVSFGKNTFDLTKTYNIASENSTSDPTLNKIAQDLIAGQNKTAIVNALSEVLTAKTEEHPKGVFKNAGPKEVTVNKDVYAVTTTEEGLISAKKNGEDVNLPAELQEEKDFFVKRLEEIGTDCGIAQTSEWSKYAEAVFPGNIFEADTENANNLKVKSPENCYAMLETAVNAATALHDAMGTDKTYYEKVLADTATVFQGLDISYPSTYQVDGKAIAEMDAAHVAEVLADQNGVLVGLVNKSNPYTAFNGSENIDSADTALAVINGRSSRNLFKSDKIRAVMEAIEDAYTGPYSVVITAEKN